LIKTDKQCAEQTIIKDELQAERDRLRDHYGSIEGEIDECRRVYEEVEGNIMKAER